MACKSLRRLGSAVFLILLAACGGEDPHLTRPTVEISAAAPTEAPSAEAAAPAVSPVPITVQTITPLPPTAAATLAPTKTRRSQTAAPTYAPLDPALPAPPTAVPTPVPLLPRDETMTLYALLVHKSG